MFLLGCLRIDGLDDTLRSKLHLGSGGQRGDRSPTSVGSCWQWTIPNSRRGCAGKAPPKWMDVVHLVLKADEPVGDSGEKHHIRNYPLQREIASMKLSCLRLARALECKLSGAAYYMHIMPSKTNLKHRNTTLMTDYFQEEYSIPNSLNVHQHCCRLVACNTANLQQNSYILMFHWILQVCKQLRIFVAKHNTQYSPAYSKHMCMFFYLRAKQNKITSCIMFKPTRKAISK